MKFPDTQYGQIYIYTSDPLYFYHVHSNILPMGIDEDGSLTTSITQLVWDETPETYTNRN